MTDETLEDLWGDEGAKTKERREKEVGKVGQISDDAIEKATSDPKEREELKEARAAINKNTDKAEQIKAFNDKVKGLSAGAKKALETAAKLAAALMVAVLLAGPAKAEAWKSPAPNSVSFTEGEINAGMPVVEGLNLNHFFTKVRAGVFMGFDGNDYGNVCAPVISVLGRYSRREYFNINLGGVKDTAGGDVEFMVSAGWRIDSYFVKFSESKFAKKILLFAVLPPIEFGPGIAWIPTKNSDITRGINWLTKF